MADLTSGPTNALAGRHRRGGIRWALGDYRRALEALPEPCATRSGRGGASRRPIRTSPTGRWSSRCAAMAMSWWGSSPRAVTTSIRGDLPRSDLVPPHRYVATYLWLRTVFDAHALVHFGKHGNLEWLRARARVSPTVLAGGPHRRPAAHLPVHRQ